MANNNVMTPSFGAAMSVMKKSFNLKSSFQFQMNNKNTPTPQNEPEILTTSSLNNLSQDPSFRLALELRKSSHYVLNVDHRAQSEDSPTKKGDLSPESRKFAETRDKKMIDKPGGDENSDVLPDEICNPNNKGLIIPLNLLRIESTFEKEKSIIPITPIAHSLVDMEPTPTKDNNKKLEEGAVTHKNTTTTEGVFKRGLRRLKMSLIGTLSKKETQYHGETETGLNATMQRSEFQRSQASFATWSHYDHARKNEKDLEEEKIASVTQSIKNVDEDASPRKQSRNKAQNVINLSGLDDSPIEKGSIRPIIENIQFRTQRTYDLSLGNSPYSSTRSPNERRRASGGLHLQEIQEETVKNAFKISRNLTLSLQILSLIVLLIITYILLAFISSLIAYPYQRIVLHLWVGQFLYGISLGVLSFGVFKLMIRMARETVRKDEEKAVAKDDVIRGKDKDAGINFFGGILCPISGLFMVLLVHSVGTNWSNAFRFIGLEITVLVFNAFTIYCFVYIKNFYESKAADEKKKGFFFVPIYKYFMSDLTHTKDEIAKNPDGLSPSARSGQGNKNGLKEEGIDKFKPKRSFEIVTLSKVLASQILVIILYIEFLAVTGFTKLYNLLQEEDRVSVGIPIVLVFPLLVYSFYKILKLIDQKAELGLMLYMSYMNAAFGTMFYRGVALHVNNFGFVWLIIASKIFHKLGVYVIYGCRIAFWQSLMNKIKGLSNVEQEASEKSVSALRPFSQTSIIEISRIDTFTSKQMKAIEKEADIKKETMQIKTKTFVLRFALIQTSDILYNISSLALFIGYRWNDIEYASTLLNKHVSSTYIVATWVELVFEVGLVIVVALCWTFSKSYNYLTIRHIFKEFFAKLAVDFLVISLPLLITYLFILRL